MSQVLVRAQQEVEPRWETLRPVLLTHYIGPNHRSVFEECTRRMPALKILLSTPMEPNRQWAAQWGGLNVAVQRSWMWTRRWKHRGQFSEANYVHLPLDTVRQLEQYQPDVVLAFEMGLRTYLSSRFCQRHPGVPLIMVANMSERTEQSRGMVRPRWRRFLARRIDWATYNGPSCKRYLEQIGIPGRRLLPAPYCAAPEHVYSGDLRVPSEQVQRILFVNSLTERKGILPLVQALARWCVANPLRTAALRVAGSGPLKQAVLDMARPPNLELTLLGHCRADQLREEYRDADLFVYPSLADEWGLGIEEAMKSGVPTVASIHAQAAETLCRNGKNAWTYCPDDQEGLGRVLAAAMESSPAERHRLAAEARADTHHITPAYAAEKLMQVIAAAWRESRPPGSPLPLDHAPVQKGDRHD